MAPDRFRRGVVRRRGRLKSCNSKSSTGYTNNWEDPRDFQILGSNDAAAWNTASGVDKWEVLGSVTDYIIGKSDHAWQEPFVLDSPGFYRYYRLRVTRTSYAASGSGSQFLMVDKLELSAS
ncbi:MAG: hypothetical protein LBC46_05840 [Treponema sp.]|nr:hypothetical protein [Treponema sp.]